VAGSRRREEREERREKRDKGERDGEKRDRVPWPLFGSTVFDYAHFLASLPCPLVTLTSLR